MIPLELGGHRYFPIYGKNGAPTGKLISYTYRKGTGPIPELFNGGELPREEGTLDLGGGWEITTTIIDAQELKNL